MKKTNERRIGTVVVFLITMLLIGGVFVNAGGTENKQSLGDNEFVIFDQSDDTVTVTIPVGEYDIRNTGYGDEVFIEDFGSLLVPGKPALPSKIFAIAIPPETEISDVTFDVGEGVILPGVYEISPVPLPRVIGTENPQTYKRNQKEYQENYDVVYENDKPYPPSVGEFVRKAGYRKYNLVDVRITPFVYQPLSGQLIYYPKVTVHVRYTPSDGKNDVLIDSLARTEKIAEEIILNYGQVKNWYPNNMPIGKGLHDFVIITLDSLISSVTPLVDWEISKGRTVEVVTTSWIDSNYNGYDLAEKMRNFLREKYPSEEWGIEDVLLVGHYDDVPMRRCWQDLDYGKPETDLYYAELSLPDSESWDDDEDHKYGENSDPIDFYSEVVVGRIPWNDPATVLSICEKSVAYEQNNDPSFKKNILLLGAFFWPDTDCAVLMETKVDQPWMSDWMMTRMYEQGYSSYAMDYNLKYSNVKSVWSSGKYSFVNWAGHGSPHSSHIYYSTGEGFATTNTCPYLNDNYPSIIFADACSNSDTDYLNIGQAMLEQGAVGFLGATKVAYGSGGWSHPNHGSSQSLDYYFTTAVTSGDYTQGEAHQWALREMYTKGLWYMDYYEMFEWGALWGNPNLGMAPVDDSTAPETPAKPSGCNEGDINVEYTFSTMTTDLDSDQIYYCFSWGDGSVDWVGPYDSGAVAEATHMWLENGDFSVMVKAQDEHGAESEWSDPIIIAIGDPVSVEISSLTGGFGARAVVKNIGEEAIVDLEWNISLDGGFLLLGSEYSGIVDISIGNEVTITTGLVFGLGYVDIVVSVDDVEKTATGFLLGPFIFGVT